MLLFALTLMLGIKLALDRAPRYQAEIKEWVHRQSGYHIAFAHVSPAFRWYGPELYFDRLELRSKDDQRVLARAAGGRIGADIWQLLRSGKLFAVRIELDSPNIVVSRVGPDSFALASEIVLGGQDSERSRLTLNDMPAGELAIRRGLVTVKNWNSALPQLEFHGVDVDLSRGPALASRGAERTVAGSSGWRAGISRHGARGRDRSQASIGAFSRAPMACPFPAGGSCCPNI